MQLETRSSLLSGGQVQEARGKGERREEMERGGGEVRREVQLTRRASQGAIREVAAEGEEEEVRGETYLLMIELVNWFIANSCCTIS